jgi:Transposase DDE domain
MHINELSKILKKYLNFHKARSDCFAQLIIAMITVKTVNFAHLATAFTTDSYPESCYKRIQRFFRFLQFDPFSIAVFVVSLFDLKNKKLKLALDRTNWKFGKLDINILMLTVAYKGIALPLMWSCLKKRGNSNTIERIALIKQIILLIGAENIDCLLGDREFVGVDWIKWLDEQNIPFLFRIRNNSLLEGKIPVNVFFKRLPSGKKVKNGKTILWGKAIYLSTRWSYNKDELVTIISNRKWQNPFKIYQKRWEIETFFGCLKRRGFCFEDTHLIHIDRIEKLICVLTIAFCWSHLVGEKKAEEAPIKKKSHGRREKSIFRYGFDELRRIFLHPEKKLGMLLRWLKLLIVNEQLEAC